MQELDFINTFFNIIYQNESAYMRDIVSSYDYVLAFRQWLKNRHIVCEALDMLEPIHYQVFSKQMTASSVEHTLRQPFTQKIKEFSEHYADQTHILYLPGFDNQEILTIDFQKYKDVYFYKVETPFQRKDLSFFDPFPAFFCAINHADLWPGILIFNRQKQVFTSLSSPSELQQLLADIDDGKDLFTIYSNYEYDSYFLQLSDMHLGKNKRQKGLMQLYQSLDFIVPYLHTKQQLKVLITGDLMESPNRKNMYLANDFMNSLKKRYKANVTFVLGNHDVIVHGFNMARNQKSKVIAYLLGESLKVLENEKIILIKMDTTSEGNLARGKIGKRQLQEIDDELSAIDNIDDYTCVAMMHHHVHPLSKAQFIKTKWHEKTFIKRIVETSKVLVDAPLLIDWLDQRHIRYVFHGHKHLPFFKRYEQQYYIGAGSATGGLKESRSRYISYNIVKYNTLERSMKTCMIFYDDKAKAERQRVEVYIFKEEKNENC